MILQVQGKLSKNEIAVPVMFRGNAGIPEVYGVIMEDDNTFIFQEFAGKCEPCILTAWCDANAGLMYVLSICMSCGMGRCRWELKRDVEKPVVGLVRSVVNLELVDWGSNRKSWWCAWLP